MTMKLAPTSDQKAYAANVVDAEGFPEVIGSHMSAVKVVISRKMCKIVISYSYTLKKSHIE